MNQTLSLSLLENAVDSLEEGLRKYQSAKKGNKRELKFCVLTISHFVELSFKHFITKINSNLIYENLYANNFKKNKTITMWEAINFYKNLKSNSTQDKPYFIKNLDWLKKLRNEIEHNKFEISLDKAENKIAHVLSTMDDLYHFEKEIKDLHTKLTKKSKELYLELVNHYKKQFKNTMGIIKKTGEKPIDCPSCGATTLLYQTKENEYSCLMCGSNYPATNCLNCDIRFPNTITEPDDHFHCCSSECEDTVLHTDRDF